MAVFLTFTFLVIAGIVSGLLASIAGLASLASYPALLLVGLPPVLANVTNTTALVFAGIGSTISSLKELHGHWEKVILFTFLSALGVIFLALLSLVVKDKFATVNAIKNVIASAANLIATFIFIFKSNISWLLVIPLGLGLLIGGYLGPVIVQHSNIHLLQVLISLASFGLAAYLFFKTET